MAVDVAQPAPAIASSTTAATQSNGLYRHIEAPLGSG
jgi:hypothetical protein